MLLASGCNRSSNANQGQNIKLDKNINLSDPDTGPSPLEESGSAPELGDNHAKK
jgi:hypothetical protein